MKKVFIVYEERENSQLCGIKGVWDKKTKAIHQMQNLIKSNELYLAHSEVNTEEGYSESDPMYNDEIYSNYYVKEFDLLS